MKAVEWAGTDDDEGGGYVSCCPSCGAPPHKLKHDGMRHTQTGSYKRVLCLGCRSWCRGIVVKGQLVYRTSS